MAVGTTGRFPSSPQVRQRTVLPQFQGNLEATPGVGGLADLIKNKGASILGAAGSLIPQKGIGNVLGGAASGAATGSAIAPGVGTVIGGVVGGIGGALNWKQQQHQKQMEALKSIRGRMNG